MNERVMVVEALSENAQRLEALFADLSEEEARRKPAPDEWSALEVLTHLRTTEAIMMPRVLQILVRPGVRLADMDDRRWATLLTRARLSISEQVAAFVARRREVVSLLEVLRPEEWAMAGEHELAGEMIVRRIAEHAVSHEREHLQQIEAIRQSIRSPKP